MTYSSLMAGFLDAFQHFLFHFRILLMRISFFDVPGGVAPLDLADRPVGGALDHRTRVTFRNTLQSVHCGFLFKMRQCNYSISLDRLLPPPHSGEVAVLLFEFPVGYFKERLKLRLQYFRLEDDILMVVCIDALVPRAYLLACIAAV